MWYRKTLARELFKIALTIFTAFFGTSAFSVTPEPPALFTHLPGKTQAELPHQAIPGMSRAVKVNYGQFRSGRFFVSLPGGVSFEAVRDFQKDLGRGRHAWVGHAGGNENSRVVIGLSGDAMAATFFYQGRLFKLEPRANGSHVLSEVDSRDPAPELDPVPVADSGTASIPEGNETSAADGGTIQDVLVAYTPSVESRYGTAGTDALIIQAIAESNQAYTNSGINTRLNLVGSVRTNYTESGSMSTDLGRLRSPGDGYMDELHTLRDSLGADLVSLIENEPQYCGIAYRMTSLSSSFASSAFSVVHHSCATGYYSFAHEIGHNQGAHHDHANASGAIYPYAYGYQEPLGAFRTVMAYNCDGGCNRVNHFSNPAGVYNGESTGVDSYADNALAINNTASTIASFRQQPASNPPSIPEDVLATSTDHSTIQISWSDTSNDESGFTVERSQTGVDFEQVASLPENATGYVDDALIADTLYSYRITAWNSAGSSAPSEIATAATLPPPPVVEQQAISETIVAGTVDGTYRDTWDADGNVERLSERQSGGKRSRRYSYLEHRWTFNVQSASRITLFADVATQADAESFTFSYSTDGTQFINMFIATSDTSGTQQFTLPSSLQGTVYVRVKDESRQPGVNTSHVLAVDRLLIRSENTDDLPVSSVPTPPTNLVATSNGADQISLTWGDQSANEDGFNLERRQDGDQQWIQVEVTGPEVTEFLDTGLSPSTLYHYRVRATNSAGSSNYSNSASALTESTTGGGEIMLEATGYKVKGRQRADLGWSGLQDTSVNVFRNGLLIVGALANGNAYTDNINVKGGGNYSYQVCGASSGECSNAAAISF